MKTKKPTRVGLVVPHIFLHRDILPRVIFSPGTLAIEMAEGLAKQYVDVTLFSVGPADTTVPNISADLSYFQAELDRRGDGYIDLLKKHPFTFVTLARQVQSELIAQTFAMANDDKFDVIHIYTNEEDIALPFAQLCKKPVVFTHHDPYNFLIKYKSVFPKYKHLNWISTSLAQRATMPQGTNWVANIYHGLDPKEFSPIRGPKGDYIAYLGRIIEPKGLHLAISAVEEYNKTTSDKIKLKIAGKHYAEEANDKYWHEVIEPRLGKDIEYVGFIKDSKTKNEFLGNAKALIIPSLFDEPFGMVMIEALASGTPLIGLNSGAIPEVINNQNGLLVKKSNSDAQTIKTLSTAITKIQNVSRQACRKDFEDRFTLERMCADHKEVYEKLQNN